MGNCLKTQLKEVVNNSNLQILGSLRIHILSSDFTSGSGSLIFGNEMQGKTVRFLDMNGNQVSTYVLGSGNVNIDGRITPEEMSNLTVPTEGYLELPDKYNINTMSIGRIKDTQINIDELKYSSIVNTTSLNNIKGGNLSSICNAPNIYLDNNTNNGQDVLTGDLSVFADKNNLAILSIQKASRVTGSLSSFNNCLKLTEFRMLFSGNNVTGEVKDLFDAQKGNVAEGKVLRIVSDSAGITYQGVHVEDIRATFNNGDYVVSNIVYPAV